MKKLLCILSLAVAACSIAQAKDNHFYQKGKLIQMDSVSCGYAEKDGKSMLGQVIGTDSGHKNTKEVLCQEYILKSDRVIYRIRPRDEKHPTLLPVGEDAQFRIQKDKLYLKVVEVEDKERDYIVVSMTPVEDRVTTASGK